MKWAQDVEACVEADAGPYTINMEVSKLGTVLRYAGEGAPDLIGQALPKPRYRGLVGGVRRRRGRTRAPVPGAEKKGMP